MRPARPSTLATLVSGAAYTSPGLSRSLAGSLRQAVLSGQFGPGSRLPSTRALAQEMGVSRNTVLEAYAQLLAEGYFEGRIGSGTFVSNALPADALHLRPRHAQPVHHRPAAATLSKRGARITGAYAPISGDALRAFNPGYPRLDPSLFAAWWRLAARRARHASVDMLNYGDPAGYLPLRDAIASHVGVSRGVRCTADRVIVTTGTQHAIALAAQLLLEPGDLAWMEDPGYGGARAAMASAAARVVPVPVDDDGLIVDAGLGRAPGARLVYVSPSHQYPLGVSMSLARRLQLLECAARSGAWVLEDDYDSEFHHGERPLPTLQSLDAWGRVLYVGTFSKVLFPALRLGYIVVPDDLIDAFRRAQAVVGTRAPTLDQATLADFIAGGHFARHLRRMRRYYQEMRAVLESSIAARIGPALRLTGVNIGLHTIARLVDGLDDRDLSQRALSAGVDAPALSDYYMDRPAIRGLVLGYGHLDAAGIRAGVERLATLPGKSFSLATGRTSAAGETQTSRPLRR